MCMPEYGCLLLPFSPLFINIVAPKIFLFIYSVRFQLSRGAFCYREYLRSTKHIPLIWSYHLALVRRDLEGHQPPNPVKSRPKLTSYGICPLMLLAIFLVDSVFESNNYPSFFELACRGLSTDLFSTSLFFSGNNRSTTYSNSWR